MKRSLRLKIARGVRKHWSEVHKIARDQGISPSEARKKRRVKGYWSIVLRTEYKGEKSTIQIEARGYIQAEDREEAIDELYSRVADYFGRDAEDFIPRSRFRVEAFRGYGKERSWMKWKHKGDRKFTRARL